MLLTTFTEELEMCVSKLDILTFCFLIVLKIKNFLLCSLPTTTETTDQQPFWWKLVKFRKYLCSRCGADSSVFFQCRGKAVAWTHIYGIDKLAGCETWNSDGFVYVMYVCALPNPFGNVWSMHVCMYKIDRESTNSL